MSEIDRAAARETILNAPLEGTRRIDEYVAEKRDAEQLPALPTAESTHAPRVQPENVEPPAWSIRELLPLTHPS